ncbi:MAG TPA: bifunctional DNA-formamidopyrimidine glycosylase/DNA-(apurinic or apyrimidinic site) lyase [Wenzhouxiangella sp.]|nr:bifunctional DNA-formamidopyrimidine glycosylase/DNA-(apurinic or apyrimidinic site) lyase [Wenzhouxiangella sp.]
MPELPEVETTRLGLQPHAEGHVIAAVTVRQPQLRWPVPDAIGRAVDQEVTRLERRGKWLIWRLSDGSLLWHLGMSGSFRVWDNPPAPARHDHIDVIFDAGHVIRYTDPRRFGALLWGGSDPLAHPRLASLGPEPLGGDFSGQWLYRLGRSRRVAVKNFIMNAAVVVGVGNIYACEALFSAGIDPRRAAGRISLQRYQRLAEQIRTTLGQAIEAGGTTLSDFTDSRGQPGYFAQKLSVYGREGRPCRACAQPVRRIVQGQRSTFFCARCQR